jgi:hypothetical protein
MPASSRSVALVTRLRSTFPHATDVVVGGVLELMIHSIEELRDRFSKVSLPGVR